MVVLVTGLDTQREARLQLKCAADARLAWRRGADAAYLEVSELERARAPFACHDDDLNDRLLVPDRREDGLGGAGGSAAFGNHWVELAAHNLQAKIVVRTRREHDALV